jgi:mediator of RNA polymerase II transcription subunit 4
MSTSNHLSASSSASAAILEQLNELQALSQKLFLSLGPPQAKPPPIPPISAFLECDAKLSAILARTYTHQMKQMRIEQLKNDIIGLDTRWRDICLELEQDQSQLEAIIKEGEKRIEAAELATTCKSMISIQSISYSKHKYSLGPIPRITAICFSY